MGVLLCPVKSRFTPGPVTLYFDLRVELEPLFYRKCQNTFTIPVPEKGEGLSPSGDLPSSVPVMGSLVNAPVTLVST